MQKSIAAKTLLLLSSFSFIFGVFQVPQAFAQSTDPTATAALQAEIDQLRAAGYNAPQLPTGYSDISLAVTQTPDTPGPNQPVSMSIVSYSTDLSKAAIGWYTNGTLTQSGTGDTTFQFTTGNVGVETTIDIVVNDIEGNVTRKSISIIPASVDLIWQADSYVPPFYEGKALYPDQGSIKIAAIPNFVTTAGARIGAATLSYAWTQDGTALGSDSGYGKDSLTISDPIPEGPTSIGVTASTLDGTIVAENTISIESGNNAPQVILYEKDPVLGIEYQSALLGSVTLSNTESTIAAIPYFFSTTNPVSSVNYKWSLNGSVVSGETGNLLTVRNQNSTAGSALLSVALTQAQDQFQQESANLTVQFSATDAQTVDTPSF